MTAPGQWSSDNPFVEQQSGGDQWSADNPFVDQSTAEPAAAQPVATLEAPTAPRQSDFLRGLVESAAGGVPRSFGTFLKTVGLEELGEPLVQAGELGAKAAEQYGQPKAPHWKDVNSIGDAVDFAQYQIGSGIGSTLPSLGAGAAGAAVGGPIGAAVAALAASYMQNTGQIKEELDQLGEEDKKSLALTLGVPVALLDAVTPVDLINRIVAKQVAKAASRGLLRQGARSAISEGITETAQEALQYGGTRAGTDQPVSLAEMMERGFEGGLAGALTGGVLGAGAGALGPHSTRPINREAAKTRDPVTLKPPADPTQEPTSDEKVKRQAEIDKLAAEEKATAERKAAAQNALLRSANAWNTLNVEQRKAVVTGLAADQYSVRWKDLTKEAKAAVRQALGASDTNLYTSPEAQVETPGVPSAPAAQGVGPAAGITEPAVVGDIPARLAENKILDDLAEMFPEVIKAVESGDVQKIIELETKHPPFNQRTAKWLEEETGVDANEFIGKTVTDARAILRSRLGSRYDEVVEKSSIGKDPTKYAKPIERRAGPRSDVSQLSMQQLEDERKRAGNKLTMLSIDAEGGPATAKGNEAERQHWQQYMNDLEAERAKRLNPGGAKQRASVENITAEDTDVVGKIEAAGQEHIGKRFRHPTRPDLVAVISKNTKKGEKPWRVTYFKQTDKGMEDYLHNHFDSPQEAYDWLTSKPEMEGDKLKGYSEEGPDEGGTPSLSQGPTPTEPTAPQGTIPEGGPTLGPAGPIGMPLELPRTINEAQKLSDRLLEELSSLREQVVSQSSEQGYARAIEDRIGNPNSDPSKHDVPKDLFNYLWTVMKDLEQATHHLMDLQRKAGVREDQLGTRPDDLVKASSVEQPTERPVEERLPDIEQRVEDLTQVEKLIHESTHTPDKWDKLYRDKLSSMTLDELDGQIDAAEQAFEQGTISEQVFRQTLNDISDAKRAIKAREAPPPPPPLKFKMPDTIGKDLNKFEADQLKNVKRAIAGLLQSPDVRGTPQEKVLKDELNRIFDYEADKREQTRGDIIGDESGSFRYNPLDWRLPTRLRRKAVKTAVRSGLPHYEQVIADRIGLEEEVVNPYTVMDRVRQIYTRVFRQGAPIGAAERLSGKKLQAHESPYILSQMSNRFLTQAEEYLRGQGPFLPDDAGGFVPTGTPSLSRISAMVGDDVERLGWLAMARRELFERADKGRTIGLDPVASKLMYLNTPEAYHQAADALAQYNHDLASYAVWGELISEETRRKFDTLFYAPIRRIFGSEIEGAGSSEVTPRGKGKRGIGGENPIKRYRGSTRRMVNPVETTVDMTARTIRAANQNKVAALLVKLAKDNPDAYRGVLEPASAAVRNKIKASLKAKAEAAKAEAADAGVELTLTEAERFIGTMGDEALAIRDNVLNVWVDGKLEHWVLHPEMAYGLKALTPHELGMLARAASVPADVQRNLIVNDPTFILTMAVVDTFQGFVNSRYGFVPVLDSFRGWWAAINNTPEFAEYRRGGGGLSSLTSKQYGKSQTSLHDIVGAPTDQGPVAQAIHQLKTYHPIEAWRTVVAPFAEAARVGEFLRARGRGASVVEAVFAAKDLVGNYSMQGGEMHALNRMAIFLNPALQVLDKTTRVIKSNPTTWFLKGSMLAGAAMILYMANSDDEEIRELRQTQGGQRYFFFRLPTGQIGKIRKPFFEGAVFAGGVEAAMDKMRGENPEAFGLWRDAILQELKVNLLPTVGVVPYQVWANKDWLSGAPIRPESNEMLEPMFQARASTGTAARIIGEKTNTSPAVIEWLARSQFGLLGSHVLNAIEGAIEWKQSGEWPIAEELPFVNRVLVRYPSSNVASIRNFYDRANEIERVAETIEYMAMNEPEMLEHYIEKHEQEIALIDIFKDTRKQLADFRQGIEDLQLAGADVVAPSDRRQISDEFLRGMIEMARSANLMHQAVKEATQ